MDVSIIIPTYHEENNIARLVTYLQAQQTKYLKEILVIDGGSGDHTVTVAQQAGAVIHISPEKGRAAQMNLGAQLAKGEILYFVHADALPPTSFIQDVRQAVQQGYPIGCFRTKFDSDKLLLKINGYCSRFDRIMCRGGDQTLFVTKALFESLGGYDTCFVVMEEYDFILRAKARAKFKIIPKEVTVSARKYDNNSYLRVNLANFIVFTMFRLGYSPAILRRTYHKLIDYRS